MPLTYVLQLFVNPKAAWTAIHARNFSLGACLLGHTLIFALIPAVAAFYGTTEVGWKVGGLSRTAVARRIGALCDRFGLPQPEPGTRHQDEPEEAAPVD